jgi:8-oxo-dGTP pyrophosphatase MutT (NUDIX family)
MKKRQISVAKMLLVNENQQALMLRIGNYRGHPEKSHTPDIPGGFVDPNESELHAVVRELKEEAGITIDPNIVTLGYGKTEYYPDEDRSVSKLLYVARIDHTPKVKTSWEHEAYEWTDLATFTDDHTMRPFYDEAIRYVVKHDLI